MEVFLFFIYIWCNFLSIDKINSKSSNSERQKTTYDEEFEDFYKIERIKHGNNETYPTINKYSKIYFKGFNPTTGKIFDSSDLRGETFYIYKNPGMFKDRFVICFKTLLYRMSKGERLLITCPSNHAYDQYGYYDIIKPYSDVTFEVEMTEPHFDPFNITFVHKSNNTISPTKNDYVEYEITVWDYNNSVRPHFTKLNAATFDNNHMYECIEETLRYMTVGDIVKIKCENKYGHKGDTIDTILPGMDLFIEIKLIDINEQHKEENLKIDL